MGIVDRLGGYRSSLAFKAPCRVASAGSNITLSGFQTIDGITLAAGDDNLRVLVKDQTDARENGIYVASSGLWQRAPDFNGNNDFCEGTRVYVHSGATGSGAYVVTSVDPMVVGDDEIEFTAASAVDINFGGLTTLALMDDEADFVSIFDASASENKKVLGKNLGFTQSGTGAVLRSLQSKLRETVSILDFIPIAEHAAIVAGTSTYNARSDFLDAFTALSAVGGGHLLLPPGRYFVTGGNLEIPKGVELIGEGWYVTPGDEDFSEAKGSIIVTDMDSGDADELIRLNSFSAVRDVCLLNTQNVGPFGTSWTPNQTPWAIAAGRFSDTSWGVRPTGAEISNVMMLGFTHGVQALTAFEAGKIERLFGQPFTIGLQADGVFDIFTIDGVHFWPFQSFDSDVDTYQAANWIGFDIGRVDGLQWRNLFTYNAAYAFRFRGSTCPGVEGQSCLGIQGQTWYADSYGIAGLYVANDITAQPLAGSINQFVAAGPSGYAIDLQDLTTALYISDFWFTGAGFTHAGSYVNVNASAGSSLWLMSGTMNEWDSGATGAAAINCDLGTVTVGDGVFFTDVNRQENTAKPRFSGAGTIKTGSGARLHNNVSTPGTAAEFRKTTSATPVIGHGVQLDLIVQTATNNDEIMGRIRAIATGVSSGNEVSELVFYRMQAGAVAEAFRATSIGFVPFLGVIYGGSSASSGLRLRSTTATGTTDRVTLEVGTNGNREALAAENDGTIKSGFGRQKAVRVVTAAGAVTVTTADHVVVVNKSVGAATTVNLPATPRTGQEFVIKDGKGDAASNNITITPAAGTIDGAATFVLNLNYQSATLVYNGTEWNVL